MIKKFISSICLISVFLSFAVSPAAFAAGDKKEILVNGDFEVLTNIATVYKWDYSGDSIGLTVNDSIVHGGKYALRYKINASETVQMLTITQGLSHLVDTCIYELSAWVYMITGDNDSVYFKLEYLKNGEGGKLEPNGEDTFKCENISIGKWREQKFKVTLPKGTVGATFVARYRGSAQTEFLLDDLSLKGERAESFVETPLPESFPLIKIYSDKPDILYDEASAEELIKNGKLEAVSNAGKPESWNLVQTGGTIDSTAENPAEGKFAVALNVTTSANGTFLYQVVQDLLPNTEYKLKGKIKVKGSGGGAVKVEWSGYMGLLTAREIPIAVSEPDKWQSFEIILTTPIKANSVSLWFKTKTSNQLLYDDLSFKGKLNTDALVKDSVVRPPAPGTSEMLVNSDFEENENGVPTGWNPTNVSWDTAYTNENVYSGKYALKLSSDSSSKNAAVEQIIELVPDCTYQLSMMINITESSSNLGVKPEAYFYSTKEMTKESVLGPLGYTPFPKFLDEETRGRWVRRSWEFVPPEGAKMLRLYIRWFKQGTAYLDDISLVISDKNTLDTNHMFYYSDLEYGIATATGSTYAFGDMTGYTVDFSLKDGDKVLDGKKGADLSGGETKYFFKIGLMTEKGKEYTVEAVYKDAGGNVINTKTTGIYKYDRPAVLTKEGVWAKDGVPLNPIIAYGVKDEELSKAVNIGVNVVSTPPGEAYVPGIKTKLDLLQKHGLKASVSVSVGSGKNFEKTKELVECIKDHPAVFAYCLQDEPYSGTSRTLEITDHLATAYKLIRDIDPVHPVLITDVTYIFEPIMKRSDILLIDLYPANADAGKTVYDEFLPAIEATYNNDSVMILNQMFEYGGYYPTTDAFRNWIYQGFFAGAKSTGVYSFQYKSPEGIDVEDAELGMALKSFIEKESEMVFDYFLNGKYQSFAQYMDEENYCYRSFVKDNDIYMMVLNRRQHDKTPVSIPLISDNLRVKIGEYSASVYAGGADNTISGKGTLDFTLEPCQAVVYKITPSTPIDANALSMTSFTDLDNHLWAKDQIAELEKLGVVNSKGEGIFKPGENITRGDFAMFLIRALGLRSVNAENFTDVPEDAYYKKELAVGKALGILKGVGDGSFGPETYISRQDMMVICARGMRVASKLKNGGKIDILSSFSDAQAIAGYASADVAAMVEQEIVKGNADGTMNPFGNSTRAEAAVIMHRIMGGAK